MYEEYAHKIERFVSRRLGAFGCACWQSADLADLVQEAFARAFSERTRYAYDGHRDYGPFLYAIARNVLVDWARAQRREVPMSLEELGSKLESVSTFETQVPWAKRATMQILKEHLRSLPLDLRELHGLRYEEGLSQTQAAQRLGSSRQTVRTLERRLLNGLKVVMTEYSMADLESRNRPF